MELLHTESVIVLYRPNIFIKIIYNVTDKTSVKFLKSDNFVLRVSVRLKQHSIPSIKFLVWK